MNLTNIKLLVLSLIASLLSFSSCIRNSKNVAGVEYMPDMYRTPAYEDNSYNALFADSMTDRMPVAGTVPRDWLPFPFPHTADGLANAIQYWKDPLPATSDIQDSGKVIFDFFCIPCHGANGMGDGLVAKKLPGPPPPYSGPTLRNITEGEIYYTIEYGKNLMGSYASQLTVNEREKLVRYVQVLQKLAPASDTSKTATASKKDTTKSKS